MSFSGKPFHTSYSDLEICDAIGFLGWNGKSQFQSIYLPFKLKHKSGIRTKLYCLTNRKCPISSLVWSTKSLNSLVFHPYFIWFSDLSQTGRLLSRKEVTGHLIQLAKFEC